MGFMHLMHLEENISWGGGQKIFHTVKLLSEGKH